MYKTAFGKDHEIRYVAKVENDVDGDAGIPAGNSCLQKPALP